jgi:flagellar basal body rod protein FlgG
MKNNLFVLFFLTLVWASENPSVQALNSYEDRYDTLMNNVVNANTPGFKASKVITAQKDGKLETMVVPLVGKAGPLVYSGDPFHAGLDGPGFFVVKGQAEDYYTRDGRFLLTLDGQLVTIAGNFPVYGQGGPIILQPGENGLLKLSISSTGQLILNDEAIDRLLIVAVDDPAELEQINGAFFRKRSGGTGEQAFLPVETPAVRQYYYEGSNVDIAEEMVSLPGVSKKFDANSKALQIMKKMRTTGREMGSPQ